MRNVLSLLRAEPRARVFFAVLTQSSLGTGAAYVALVLVAYERFSSPWAIGLILLADVFPAMALGPVFGAAADRWPRRTCAVLADLIRAVAFCGIVFADGFVPTLAFAVLAGVGTALFTPSSLASLPSLVEEQRLPAATSLYGAITDLGFVVGPALAAAALLFADVETILAVNGATFLLSGVVLARLTFGAAPVGPDHAAEPSGLLREAWAGVKAIRGTSGLGAVLLASAAALFFGGVFNVAELLLAGQVLGGGDTGYSILVGIYGAGFIAGSLSGAKGGETGRLRQWYLAGLLLMALGFGVSGLAPNIAFAAGTFVVAGLGNGMMLVYERLLIQKLVPDTVAGRVFGLKDALTAWAFALAFLSGPGIVAGLGTRGTLLLVGAGGLVVWAVALGVVLRQVAGTRQTGATRRAMADAPFSRPL